MVKPDTPVIGVDLDDVLWGLLDAWLLRYNEITDDNVLPGDIKSWDIAQYIHKGTKEMLFYILEQSDFWEMVQPYTDAQEYLKKLVDGGYDVVIVTASSHKTLNAKLERFYKLFLFIKTEQVIVTKRKQMIDMDVLIDDNPENLRDASYRSILFNTPHNEAFNETEIGAVRMHDWREIYEYITEVFPVVRG